MTTTSSTAQKAALPLRHILATLVYRGGKTLRQAPPDFSGFRPAKGSRSAGEILAHICDLLDWVLSQAKGQERWRNSKPNAWEADTERFFAAATALDAYLNSGAELHAPAEKLFQGGLAGAPVRGENYAKAKIEIGRTGADQSRPVQEFD